MSNTCSCTNACLSATSESYILRGRGGGAIIRGSTTLKVSLINNYKENI